VPVLGGGGTGDEFRELGGVAKGSSVCGREPGGVVELSSGDFTDSFFRGDVVGAVAADPCLRRLPVDEEDLSDEVPPAAFDARVVMALAVRSRARVAMDSKLPRAGDAEVFPGPGELGLKEGGSDEDCGKVNLVELRRPAVECGSW